ncbi:MAG: hypothetical protein PHG82_01655 [Candidatus Gracilibacteria bacterium]|nr:hypothetical protein [Candidatus Gracilibacteria bacterium]
MNASDNVLKSGSIEGSEILIDIADNGSDLMSQIGCNGEGLSNEELAEMEVAGEVFVSLHRNDIKDELNYKKDLKEIFENQKGQIDSKKAVEHIVEQIGRLDSLFGNKRYEKSMTKENAGILREIETKGIINIQDNCYFVPGSLSSLRKLVQFGILEGKDVIIKLGKGVNLQEGIRFVLLEQNGHENALRHFRSGTKLEKLELDIGDDSSMAHSASFHPKKLENGNYEISIKSGKNVFFGINSVIGSGADFGDNTVIWWNSLLGTDVKIGKDSLVGTSVEIDDSAIIPDNCLIPNFAHIGKEIVEFDRKKFKTFSRIVEEAEKNELIKDDKLEKARDYLSKSYIITASEYIEDQLFYDSELVGADGARKFIVKFDSSEDLVNGVKKINPDYEGMLNFNSHHVTPENKIFSAITSMFDYLERNVSSFESAKEFRFQNTRTVSELTSLLGGKIGESILQNELDTDTIATFRPYPKNTERFITHTFPYILELLDHNVSMQEIQKILDEELEWPKMDEEYMKKVCLGRVVITGKCDVSGENSLLYDALIRSDEVNYSKDEVRIENSVFAKVIMHGGGTKESKDVIVLNTVFHGGTSIVNENLDSMIVGDYEHPSTYNNTQILDSNISEGDITCNNAIIVNSYLGNGVSIAGGAHDGIVTIKNSRLLDTVSIAPKVSLNSVEIKEKGYYVGKGQVFNNIVITGKGLYSKKKI